jgi:hypothetical protein
MMRKSLRIIALVLAATIAPTVLRADPTDITYTLDLGTGVSGTITTDGNTTTSLATTDIAGYNITLTYGQTSITLDESNSHVIIVGPDLTATATDLYFNFDDDSNLGSFSVFDDDTANLIYQNQAVDYPSFTGEIQYAPNGEIGEITIP